MSQRLLIQFSYIGSSYRGLQRIYRRDKSADLETVQGILEYALTKLLHTKDIELKISSRTDSGVHAISSYAHFDYNFPDGNHWNAPCPERLCESLNVYLEKNLTSIRLQRIVQIPNEYHCRSGILNRTYCYKLAVAKSDEWFPCRSTYSRTTGLPISLVERCQLVFQPFDAESVQTASKLFIGTKNFRSFSKDADKGVPQVDEDYVKTIHRVSVTRVNNPEISYDVDNSSSKFDFYDIHFEGSGFLRRQVRKMVGVLLGIGQGKIKTKDIQYMLDNPHERNWHPLCNGANSDGLFLKSMQYINLPILRGFLS